MYESVTYEELLERMLSRNPDSLDKREGSLLYNAHAPAAVELQKVYMELDAVLKEMFADTASREFLVKRAAERGVVPKAASCAVMEGRFLPEDLEIPENSRFRCEDCYYRTAERLSAGRYRMICETVGTAGNRTGALLPVDYIDGLERAELAAYLIPGEDEEETEAFRKRYFAGLHSQAFGGNIADYREKVMAIAGVGGVKVYPAWNGGGTVKLVMINSEYRRPSDALVKTVQDAVDPEPDRGMGYGLAPIGHTVTVEGAGETAVSVSASITYLPGYDFERCREELCQVVDGYLKELNRGWAEESETIVRLARLESRMLDVTGVLDLADTKINGESGNFVLPSNHLAVRGEVIG